MPDDRTEGTGVNTAASNGANNNTPPKQSANLSDSVEEARIIEETVTPASKPVPPSITPPPVVPPRPLPPVTKIVPPAPSVPPLATPQTTAPRDQVVAPELRVPQTPPAVPPITPKEELGKRGMIVPPASFGSFVPKPAEAIGEKKVVAPSPIAETRVTPPPFTTPPLTPQPEKVTPAPLNALTPSEPIPDVGLMLKSIKLPERREVPGKEAPEIKPKAYDTSLAAAVSDTAKKIEEAPAAAAPIPKSSVMPLRTLKNDFQDIVRDQKISLVRAASMEQDKQRNASRLTGEIEQKVVKSHRTFKIVAATVLFVILGIAVFVGVLLIQAERSATTNAPSNSSILFAESTTPLPLSNRSSFDIKSALSQMRRGESALGSITRVVPVIATAPAEGSTAPGAREATLEEFLSSLGTSASSNLVRALGGQFFFGIHTVDENAPVFVIPVTSYERAFAGMLEWEGSMNADLSPVFTSVPNTIVGEDGLLQRRAFEDLIMRNYDTRALKDNAGVIQLFYAFPTRNILIIAESPYSFVEVLARLRAERRI